MLWERLMGKQSEHMYMCIFAFQYNSNPLQYAVILTHQLETVYTCGY